MNMHLIYQTAEYNALKGNTNKYEVILSFDDILRPTIAFEPIIDGGMLMVCSYNYLPLYKFKIDELVKRTTNFIEAYNKERKKILSASNSNNKELKKAVKKLKKWESKASYETRLLLELKE